VSVALSEHDAAWPARFTAEADQIRAALGPGLRRIEHVGSTAVPGLVARPIVDIALSVEELDALDTAAVEALGYRAEESGLLVKRGFVVWTYELEPEEFMDHVRVRDYLRTHPEDREGFAALKRRCAHAGDASAYEAAKGAFVTRLVAALRRD
jgi:GrpB-like predicted nucleotidyltransferase (UPF0157 family)